MRKITMLLMVALAALALSATAAFAAYTFDPATGTGFVGKGDVQLIYGWNNQQLQTNAGSVQFRASTTSETTWTCSKPHPNDPTKPDTISFKGNETTTQGVVSKIDRVRNQINGFNLTGYSGTPTTVTSGDALYSCGGGESGFTYDNNAVTTTGATKLEVSIDGSTWYTLTPPATTTV